MRPVDPFLWHDPPDVDPPRSEDIPHGVTIRVLAPDKIPAPKGIRLEKNPPRDPDCYGWDCFPPGYFQTDKKLDPTLWRFAWRGSWYACLNRNQS